jgi:hypothetical protein
VKAQLEQTGGRMTVPEVGRPVFLPDIPKPCERKNSRAALDIRRASVSATGANVGKHAGWKDADHLMTLNIGRVVLLTNNRLQRAVKDRKKTNFIFLLCFKCSYFRLTPHVKS